MATGETGGAGVEGRVATTAVQAERIAKLQATLAERDATIAAQAEQLAKLSAQVAELKELLGRNSRNSHFPPSSDGPGAGSRNGPPKPRQKSGRKRGGQKGHRGSHRVLLPAERVNTVVDLFPEACEGCADSLPEIQDAAACRYQQLGIRDHRPHLTEWRRHEVHCKRCYIWTRAPHDPQKIPNVAFGPCLTAVVVLLTGAYHLSRRKTRKLLQELFGISVSLGAISSMERLDSKALKPAHEEALREARSKTLESNTLTPRLGRARASSRRCGCWPRLPRRSTRSSVMDAALRSARFLGRALEPRQRPRHRQLLEYEPPPSVPR